MIQEGTIGRKEEGAGKENERKGENPNIQENEAAQHMISARFYRITLAVADVSRKEAHAQDGRRTILGRCVRGRSRGGVLEEGAGCLEN